MPPHLILNPPQPAAYQAQSLADFSPEMFASSVLLLPVVVIHLFHHPAAAFRDDFKTTTNKVATRTLVHGATSTISDPILAATKASDQILFSSFDSIERAGEGKTSRHPTTRSKNSKNTIINGSSAGNNILTPVLKASALGAIIGSILYC